MIRLIHAEVEVLYGTLYQPACENAAGRDALTGKPVEMTTDDAQVTCRKCLSALGYEAAPVEQLTVCQPDPMPMRRAA